MFKLTRPCINCPFRKGVGETFCFGRKRLDEILNATAFQCHKTVNYDEFDDAEKCSGEHPQQCAGLMSLLHREDRANTIMQVGERLGAFDPARLDHSDVYDSIAAATIAHGINLVMTMSRTIPITTLNDINTDRKHRLALSALKDARHALGITDDHIPMHVPVETAGRIEQAIDALEGRQT